MPVKSYSFIELIAQACAEKGTTWEQISQNMTNLGLDPTSATDIVNSQFKDVLTTNQNLGGGANVWYYPAETIETWNNNIGQTLNNSNLATIERANVSIPVNTSVSGGGGGGATTTTFSTAPKSGGMGVSNAVYLLANVAQAIGCASTGIWLGKQIDGALYNANPDYWDSIGMSSLNPETWNSITNGDDSFGAGLFNMIFGLDPSTGNTQAYMDENALAYMAMVLNSQGWFSASGMEFPTHVSSGTYTWNTCMSLSEFASMVCNYPVRDTVQANYNSVMATYGNYKCIQATSYFYAPTFQSSLTSNVVTFYCVPSLANPISVSTSLSCTAVSLLFQWYPEGFTGITNVSTRNSSVHPFIGQQEDYNSGGVQYYTGGGFDVELIQDVDGVSNQDGATLPDTSNWNDLASTLAALQNQYPDSFTNPLTYDVLQPDGTVETHRYIPVPYPEVDINNMSQPVSNTDISSQTQPQIAGQTQTDPTTKTLLDLLTQLLQQPKTQTETETQTDTPPQNPVDTGTGTTPVPTVPTGSASALWAVYHPTQAEVNSLGAWLWTDNIITQIQQVLQNPMEGIITLHKVFATPVDSGTGTIVIGRLDSQVSSATVTQQYVSVDCGDINCYESFGNVFDYEPYTKVSLYLPFIGIVPLNVSDVMRSTINVTYGVDVFTGACLAMVAVNRDGNTINMYQYAGVCSVEYPLTGSVHSGLINGLLGVAGGVAGIAMASTGVGVVAGATAIAGGVANSQRSNNARASGFSGNAGAMGIKKPYLIIERPQTKVADDFVALDGYPTNASIVLGACSGHVKCSTAHIHSVPATDSELSKIEALLLDGVIV